jgi:hypothetical protein
MANGKLYSNSFASYTPKKGLKTSKTKTKIIVIRREASRAGGGGEKGRGQGRIWV